MGPPGLGVAAWVRGWESPAHGEMRTPRASSVWKGVQGVIGMSPLSSPPPSLSLRVWVSDAPSRPRCGLCTPSVLPPLLPLGLVDKQGSGR